MHPTVYTIPFSVTTLRKDILLLLASGNPAKKIAGELYRSHRTIENEKHLMMKALNCKREAQLIAEAFRLKIID